MDALFAALIKSKKKQRKSHEAFVLELAQVDPNIFVVGTYVNYHTPIELRCKKCNLTWFAAPSSILSNKSGCPHCAVSRGEKRILNWLKTFGVSYTPQKKLDGLLGAGGGLLSYDFYISDQGLLIIRVNSMMDLLQYSA